MKRLPYLVRNRFGTFYFRLTIPKQFRTLSADIPKEIRRSLGTNLIREAAPRAHLLLVEFESFFNADMAKVTGHQAAEMLKKILAENRAKEAFKKAKHKEQQRQLLEQAAKKHDPNAFVDADGNICFGGSQQKQAAGAAKSGGPLLSEVITKFVDEKERSGTWRPKSKQENEAIYRLFERIVGDVPFVALNYESLRHYKETLLRLPANLNKDPRYRDKPIEEVVKLKSVSPMSMTTANKSLTRLGTLFDWAEKHGYTDKNYARGLTVKGAKHKERQAFTNEDLEKLLGSDAYQGKNGKRFPHRYQYWLPLLAMYTGARLNELCQLHVADIQQKENTWIIAINDTGEKRLKNKSSIREVPIHSQLIKLGFLKFVTAQRKQKQVRLFPELPKKRDGYGANATKWFARYRESCGVAASDAQHMKDFHSFRHTVVAHLQAKGIEEAKIAAVVGHKHDTITFGTYGKGFSLAILKEVVEAIGYFLKL